MKVFSNLFTTGVMLAGLVCVTTACNSPRGGVRTEGQLVDDKKLTRSVESRLANDPVYKYRGLDVRTFNGVVQLSGFVEADVQRQRAEELTRDIPGVQSVENAIMVKPPGLERRLRDAEDIPYPEARGGNTSESESRADRATREAQDDDLNDAETDDDNAR